jgi:hypothetical protein
MFDFTAYHSVYCHVHQEAILWVTQQNTIKSSYRKLLQMWNCWVPSITYDSTLQSQLDHLRGVHICWKYVCLIECYIVEICRTWLPGIRHWWQLFTVWLLNKTMFCDVTVLLALCQLRNSHVKCSTCWWLLKTFFRCSCTFLCFSSRNVKVSGVAD